MKLSTYKSPLAVLVMLLAMVPSAFAVIDISAATTGISDASVALLAVLAAMIVMAAAVWGVRKVVQFFRG